ncbi:hypothetical protein SeMB42_g07231 [Synchytrium endobioticum]|nr:hypothetical protein SeMB42_g07231 [Synchytrium endobioticum]
MPYKRPDGTYEHGLDDVYIVAIATCLILLAKEAVKHSITIPVGTYCRVYKQQQKSYIWQTWLFICHTVSMCWGLYLFATEPKPYYKDFRYFWIGYPHQQKYLTLNMKLYYLVELAYWVHHLIILQTIVPRRKDYLLMMSHHVVTIILITASYHMNFTMLGHIILFLFDVSDVFLALSKALKYCGFVAMVDVCTAVFAVSWLMTRHFGMSVILRSVLFDAPVLITERKWNPEEGNFYSWNVYYFFLVLIAALEIMCAWWLYLILKIAWNMIRGHHADDDRSDDEDAADNEQDELEIKDDGEKEMKKLLNHHHSHHDPAKRNRNGAAVEGNGGTRKRN